MLFYIAFLIICLAGSVITIKTLVGYSDLRSNSKYLISALVLIGWFAPLYINFLSRFPGLNRTLFNVISYAGYSLFGLAFILLMLLLLRDFLWFVFYGLAKLLGHGSWSINPKNISLLDTANLYTAGAAVLITLWGLYAGAKSPEIREINLTTPLINRPLTIVQLSDLHITRSTPLRRVKKIVSRINEYFPDMVFMTGDIIDDRLSFIEPQIDLLAGLKPTYGVWSVMGNHEFYNGVAAWDYKFKQLGFNRLFNRGELIENTNVFIAGVPDLSIAQQHPVYNVNLPKTLAGSGQDNYRILLSHHPQIADSLTSANINLQLSGHTHGGQIFPFHLLAAKANTYLAGRYRVNGFDLYVSPGAGTWGPSLRLLAPSEITVIRLNPVDSMQNN